MVSQRPGPWAAGFLEDVLKMFGRFREDVWKIVGIILELFEYVCRIGEIVGGFSEDSGKMFWRLSEVLMEEVLMIFRRWLDDFWKMF